MKKKHYIAPQQKVKPIVIQHLLQSSNAGQEVPTGSGAAKKTTLDINDFDMDDYDDPINE